MPTTEQVASRGDSPLGWQRTAIAALAFLAVVHTILIAIWLAPASPIRDAVGAPRLASYVDPYFQQSWGQADPSSQVVDERLLIRAEVLDVASGKKHKTGWLDVTKAEQSALLHHLQPARVHLINRRLATNLNAITYSMSPEQEKVLKKNYVKGTSSVLAKSLYEVGGAPNMIASYLAYDRMTTQFATMYSTAVWGDEITKIQYQVGRKILPPFADRERTAQLKFDYFSFGWRRALPVQEEAQSQFDSYVKK